MDEAGIVIPYEAPPGELRTAVGCTHASLAVAEYAEQKAALDAHHEATGIDVFVASYDAYERDGRIESRCVWTDGAATWLPSTDVVALVTGLGADGTAARIVIVPFDAVRDRLTEVVGTRPARFETGAFPTGDALDALARAHGA